ncbi:nose resistant to fluoxetine protein 6-like [Haemaphysalis longicornis]
MATLAVLLIIMGQLPLRSSAPVPPEAQYASNITRDLAHVSDLLLRTVWPIASEAATGNNVSVPCTSALFKMFLALKRQEPWLIKMLLSNGFLPSNLLEGGVVSLGGYEQCLHTSSRDVDGEARIRGQYCSLFLRPPRQFMVELVGRFNEQGDLQGRFSPLIATADNKDGRQSIRLGICTPSACTDTDLSILASSVLQQYGIEATVQGCRSGEDKKWSWAQVLSIAILSTLGCLVLLGTAAERWRMGRSQISARFLNVLVFFSAISNTRSLLKTRHTGLNNSLLFMSGLKVFCAYWVLLDHEYIAVQPEFLHSPFELMRLSSKPWFQFVTNGVLSVTTFFYMSGFALSFSTAGSEPTVRAFLLAVVRRYIRLTFPVLVVVLMAFIVPLLADGPSDWELLPEQLSGCYSNWWSLVIHVNDFIPRPRTCLRHLWYVSADMQIFATIALPLTMLLKRNRRVGFSAAAVISVAFATLAAVQTYNWHLFHAITFGNSDVRRFADTLEYIHFKPFVHIPTYVCGVVCGSVARNLKVTSLRQGTQVLLWLLSAGFLSFVMFITIPWNAGHYPPDAISALYGGFHRLVWAIGLCWPFLACASGKGGVLYRLLAWKALLPVSRLTYGIYLVHLLLHLLRMANTKTPINVDEFLQLRNSVGTFGLSVPLAFVLYIICEGPIQQMEKVLFKKKPTCQTPVAAPENGSTMKSACEVVPSRPTES